MMTVSWFETLMGFSEQSPIQVQNNIKLLEGNVMKSIVNGKEYVYGEIETPSLCNLKERVKEQSGLSYCSRSIKNSVREVVGDIQMLHMEEENAGALFQVASQFNLLEMVSPRVTPDSGVTQYEFDRTQGPACAIAAGAGTIYRNYFVPIPDSDGNVVIGQSRHSQIDCLADVGLALGNQNNRLWTMRNGYCLANSESSLMEISSIFNQADETELDRLRGLLKVGIMWNTQVTLPTNTGRTRDDHLVTQIYCSALPVAYSDYYGWERFARFVLEAAYEATMSAAVLNLQKTGNNKVFLTLLGGGAFENDEEWIMSAIKRSLKLYSGHGLDVFIVSYGWSKPEVQEMIGELEKNAE
jgi:hypothetical protein